MHNTITQPLWKAEAALKTAEKAHKKIPVKIRLGKLAPGQQVLDTETKLIHTGIRMAAYNTAMTIARETAPTPATNAPTTRPTPSCARPSTHQATSTPTVPGFLTIRLEPLPTQAKTDAIAELCDHLTATQTRCPGTGLILKFAIKSKTLDYIE